MGEELIAHCARVFTGPFCSYGGGGTSTRGGLPVSMSSISVSST